MIFAIEAQFSFPTGLGVPHPVRLVKEAEQQITRDSCIICFEAPAILEQHHIAGRDNSSDTVTLCLTCHGRLTTTFQPKWLDRWPKLACYYFGWSDIFELLGQKTDQLYFHELSKKFAQKARYAE
jgi:hypothetical protein